MSRHSRSDTSSTASRQRVVLESPVPTHHACFVFAFGRSWPLLWRNTQCSLSLANCFYHLVFLGIVRVSLCCPHHTNCAIPHHSFVETQQGWPKILTGGHRSPRTHSGPRTAPQRTPLHRTCRSETCGPLACWSWADDKGLRSTTTRTDVLIDTRLKNNHGRGVVLRVMARICPCFRQITNLS